MGGRGITLRVWDRRCKQILLLSVFYFDRNVQKNKKGSAQCIITHCSTQRRRYFLCAGVLNSVKGLRKVKHMIGWDSICFSFWDKRKNWSDLLDIFPTRRWILGLFAGIREITLKAWRYDQCILGKPLKACFLVTSEVIEVRLCFND